MNQRGFSLTTAMVSVAIAGIAMVASLAIIRSITVTLNLSQASNEVGDQFYELRTALTDPATCLQNLGTVNLSAGTVALTQPLRPLIMGGTTLNPNLTLLPDKSVQEGLRAYSKSVKIARSLAIANIAHLSIEFESPSFPTQSVLRQMPLSVLVNETGLITACTAGSPGLLTSSNDGGSCDEEPPHSAPSEAGRKEMRQRMCSALTFPTPSNGGEIDCLTFRNISFDMSKKEPQKSWMLGMTTEFSGSSNFLECNNGPKFTIREFRNLNSMEECLAVPYFPEGTMSTLSEGTLSNTSMVCLNGRWITILTPASLSNEQGE